MSNFTVLICVRSVKRKDFANMTRLVDLTLSRNTISYITPHAFADLENLRALHLNRYGFAYSVRLICVCDIMGIAWNPLDKCEILYFFSKATKYSFINLSVCLIYSNRLTRIGNDTFSGMSKLHHLILNNNQLVLIHQGAFNDLLALEELDLSYNNLDSIPWDSIQVRISLNRSSLSNPFGWRPLKKRQFQAQ